jgi:HAD superfamily hydrolase (TIGR01509 family)
LQPVAHVEAMLDSLAAPFCVASSSTPERLAHALALTGLDQRFRAHIFSASLVARGKPAPDLFLHAAREMGITPRRCVVVEDSRAGV